jgi:hypothetical protein
MTNIQRAEEMFSIIERKINFKVWSMEFDAGDQTGVAGEKISFAINALDAIRALKTEETNGRVLETGDSAHKFDRRFHNASRDCSSFLTIHGEFARDCQRPGKGEIQ